MTRDTFGSAKLSAHTGFEKNLIFNGSNVIFGKALHDETKDEKKKKKEAEKKNERPLYWGAAPSRHFVTVAPTRSGKGSCLIIPTLLFYKGSVIVIDPKGENAYITAERRRQMGQKTFILDPWEEVNRRYGVHSGIKEEVAHFNPLSSLDPESEHFADDVAYIADSLIINQGKDPHWDDSARELVAGLIAFAVQKYEHQASLPLVRLMLTRGPIGIAKISQEAQDLGDYENLATRKLCRFVDPEDKETKSIISTALTQLAFLDSTSLAENLSESDFSFSDLITGNTTIYLVLPVDKLQTYGRWLRLMISVGIQTVARKTEKLNLPILFILDEFGTIGKLSAVSQAVGLMAGMQMCIWAFVQDLNQMKHDYEDQWETFVSNAECLTGFNVMDQFTTEYISKMMGTSTVERISEETAAIRKGGLLFKGNPEFGSMKDQVFSRALFLPDEIRRLPSSLGFCILNHDPFLFEKMDYYKHEFMFKLCRPDPYFPNPNKPAEEERDRLLRIYEDEKKDLLAEWPTLPEDIQKLCDEIEELFQNKEDISTTANLMNDLRKETNRQKILERLEAIKDKAIEIMGETTAKAKDLAVGAFNKFKKSETSANIKGKMSSFFKKKET